MGDERYVEHGLLGRGGFGEVVQVYDAHLCRRAARKRLLPELAGDAASQAIFQAEARLTAQLRHPGIVALYELQVAPLGFTMDEVVGRSLQAVIDELHREGAPDAVALHGAIETLVRVCETIAYAHEHGVVHRDLKPANIMVGSFGRVLVLDWGGATVLPSSPLENVAVLREADQAEISGTAHYMAPEAARGEPAAPTADVWGLGAVLYATLSGSPPFARFDPAGALAALARDEEPEPLQAGPFELRRVIGRAMAVDPRDRFSNAAELAVALRAFLAGARRRELAQEKVRAAGEGRAQREADARRAQQLRLDATETLDRVQYDDEAQRRPAWALLEEAEKLQVAAALAEVREELELHAALELDPTNRAAHLALAERYLQAAEGARAVRDPVKQAMAEARMRHHLDAVPRRDPGRRALMERFAPRRVRLSTSVEREVELCRFVSRDHRRVLEPVRSLGSTPLEVELEPGRWALRVGIAEDQVVLPIDPSGPEPFVPEGSLEPVQHTLVVPPPGQALVPAGWFTAGGDPGADDSLPRQHVWLDAFVIDVFPVTNRGFIAFLDDLVDQGREQEALRYAPRERGASPESVGAVVFGRDERGHFFCQADADGDVWGEDEPVVLVDWFGASAFAAWRSARDGVAWRLPTELEWEKAARGADERLFPWGDRFDPGFCCMRDSHVGRRAIPPVDSFPTDCSPYGVRGLGGGVRDWCADAWLPDGVPLVGGRPVPQADPQTDAPRVERGGAWYGFERDSRVTNRFATAPTARFHNIGFRLCRSVSE